MPRCSTGLTAFEQADLPPSMLCAPDRSRRGSIFCWTRPLSFGSEPSRSRWIGRIASRGILVGASKSWSEASLV